MRKSGKKLSGIFACGKAGCPLKFALAWLAAAGLCAAGIVYISGGGSSGKTAGADASEKVFTEAFSENGTVLCFGEDGEPAYITGKSTGDVFVPGADITVSDMRRTSSENGIPVYTCSTVRTEKPDESSLPCASAVSGAASGDTSLFGNGEWLETDNGRVLAGQSLWDAFTEKTSAGKPASVKLADISNGTVTATWLFSDGMTYCAAEYAVSDYSGTPEVRVKQYRYLESITAGAYTLRYLTDTQGIGGKLLRDGTLASLASQAGQTAASQNAGTSVSSVSGTGASQQQIDMFWLWFSGDGRDSGGSAVWSEKYAASFPSVSLNWTPSAAQAASSGSSEAGGNVSLPLSSAVYTAGGQKSELKGTDVRAGDLSSEVAECAAGSRISFSADSGKGGTFVLSRYRGTDIGNLSAEPAETQTSSDGNFSVTAEKGVSFFSVSWEDGSGNSCIWNFTVSAS